ncbi:MAG: TatD family hydrolase [Bacteroidales bacterium]|nr:TatD family hydrolase [Bacteroidales bacterium]
MLRYVDTHTHLYSDAYTEGCGVVVDRAVEAGVTKLVFPDINSKTRADMFSLAAKYPGTAYACIGLHPTEVGDDWKEEMDAIMACKAEVSLTCGVPDALPVHKSGAEMAAIGETGLDCHYSTDNVGVQEEVFRIQLDLALEMGLPVIIHNRDATERVLNVLEDYKGRGLRGVFHAYGGSWETFSNLHKYGDFYVGIGGVVTFKKASIAETVKRIPLERIITETDAPWLAPTPYRGQRNESAYIPLIVEKIAAQKEVEPEAVAEAVWKNTHDLFNI